VPIVTCSDEPRGSLTRQGFGDFHRIVDHGRAHPRHQATVQRLICVDLVPGQDEVERVSGALSGAVTAAITG
jgi:hypothetical protein